MGRLFPRLLVGLLLGVAVYAGLAIYLGVEQLAQQLSRFTLWRLAPVLLLTLGNYALRYLKWEVYLRTLQLRVPAAQSVTIFLGGLAMAISPGKVGELLKAYLLKRAQGVPIAHSAPVVIAERVTDLIALLLLMLLGLWTFGRGRALLVLPAALVGALLLLLYHRGLAQALLGLLDRVRVLKRPVAALRQMYESTARLFRARPLVLAVLLSLAGWACECAGLWVIVGGFGVSTSWLLCTFIYAATTLGGLPTPGGIGLTDGGMTALLRYSAGLSAGAAGAATLLVRLCTLWFAVVVGVLALLIYRRGLGLGGDDESPPG